MNTDTIPAPSVSSALTVQGRVIYALVLREVHTLYGNTRLGYLWAIIQTAFNIAVFWLFREFLGAHSRHGMGIGVFLLCGFIPWHMVSHTLSRCMSAVRANQALLTFPQVTELDLMIARVVVVWGTQSICAVVILIVVVSIGQVAELRNPGTLAATLLFAPLLGIGMGLVFASLARLWPTLERLVPIVMRFLFFASDILLLNPVSQIIEWQRYGFSASSAAPMHSIAYIVVWCLSSLCLGLLLERYVRGRELK